MPPAPRPGPGPGALPPALRLADAAAVLLFLGLTFLLGAFPLKDTDFWWHLRTGDLIRQTGQVPRVDNLTFGAEGHPWIDLHWLFQVGLSWGHARFGVPGLTLIKCAISTVAVALLLSARRREWPVWVAVLAWLPALLVLGGRMYIRPETLTLLYLSMDLAILFRWDRRPALAFLLPLIQVAWVNTQGLFVFGPILLVFALIDAVLRPGAFDPARRAWWRTVGIATALVGVACLVNPYGLKGALYPLELAGTMRNPAFRDIGELQSIPSFIADSGLTSLVLCIHLAVMLLGGLSFVVPIVWAGWTRVADARGAALGAAEESPPPDGKKARRRKADTATATATKTRRRSKAAKPAASVEPSPWGGLPFRFFLFASFSALSLAATRNSHQFAAVVGTVTAWNFAEWAAAIRARNLRLRPEGDAPARRIGRRVAAMAAVALVLTLVGSGQFYAWAGEGRVIGLGEEKHWFPHDAVRFAGRPGMPTRMVGYHEGLPALYEYYYGPGHKVYADARLEVMGAKLYGEYIALRNKISDNQPGWTAELDGMGRPAMLVDTLNASNAGVVASLFMARQWRCVWFDSIAAVFVHVSSADVIRDHEVDFLRRHYQPEGSSDSADPEILLATAKTACNVSSLLIPRPGGDLPGLPLVLVGLDAARRLRTVTPADFNGWKQAGLLELIRDPLLTSRVAIPRFRLPFDPVFDLPSIRASAALRRTLAQVPDDGLSLLSLARSFGGRLINGVLYGGRGMDEAALPLIERFIQLPTRNRSQQVANLNAMEQIALLRSQLGPKPATTWANLGDLDRVVTELLARGWAASAADVMEGAYKPEARSWAWADRLAVLRLHLGEPDRARAIWLAVREPASPALRLARVAHADLAEDRIDAARQGYLDAVAADPQLFEAHYALAVLEQDVGRLPEARAALARAEATAPNDHSRDAVRRLGQTIPAAR